jgi:hypothetical protein
MGEACARWRTAVHNLLANRPDRLEPVSGDFESITPGLGLRAGHQRSREHGVPEAEGDGSSTDMAYGAGYVNPIGVRITLIAAILMLIGTVLPIHTLSQIPFPHNSFIASGRWWVTVISVAMGGNAALMLLRPRADDRNRAWAGFAGSLVALIAGIWGLTTGFQQIVLDSNVHRLPSVVLPASVIQAHAGVGVYVVLISGVIGQIGSFLMFRNRDWMPHQQGHEEMPGLR